MPECIEGEGLAFSFFECKMLSKGNSFLAHHEEALIAGIFPYFVRLWLFGALPVVRAFPSVNECPALSARLSLAKIPGIVAEAVAFGCDAAAYVAGLKSAARCIRPEMLRRTALLRCLRAGEQTAALSSADGHSRYQAALRRERHADSVPDGNESDDHTEIGDEPCH